VSAPRSTRGCWVRKAEIDGGVRPGTTTAEAERIAEPHAEDLGGLRRGGARPPHHQVVAHLDAHRHDVVDGREVGVESICAALNGRRRADRLGRPSRWMLSIWAYGPANSPGKTSGPIHHSDRACSIERSATPSDSPKPRPSEAAAGQARSPQGEATISATRLFDQETRIDGDRSPRDESRLIRGEVGDHARDIVRLDPRGR